MSGSVRKLIKLAQNRLAKAIERAAKKTLVVETKAPPEEVIQECQKLIRSVVGERAAIEKAQEELIRHMSSWDEIVAAMQDAEQAAEETKLMEQWANQEKSHFQTLDEAGDTLMELASNEALLDEVLEEARMKLDGQKATQVRTEVPATRNSTSTTAEAQTIPQNGTVTMESGLQPVNNASCKPMVKLPEMHLRDFDGDITDWQPFWDNFRSTVDCQPLPKVQKLTYLLSTLKGRAKQAVEGSAITDSNYDIVVSTLKRRFGDTDVIKHKLLMELANLPVGGEKTFQVRQLFEKIERIYRQLEQLGETLEGSPMHATIESKLPRWVLLHVYEEKSKTSEWTISQLLECVDKMLLRRESIDSMTAREETPKPRYFARKTVSAATSVKRIERIKTRCVFCEGQHWSTDCTTFKTPQARINRLVEQRRCKKCMKLGHNEQECNSKKKCYYCDGQHNSAMCPRGDKKKEGATNSTAADRKGNGQNSTVAVGMAENEDQPEDSVEEVAFSKSNRKKAREEVLLLTKEVVVINDENPQKQVNTVAFFDPGSQMSFITEDVIKRLGSKPNGVDDLTIKMLEGYASQEKQIERYRVRLCLVDGSTMELDVSMLEKITDKLRTPAIVSEDQTTKYEEGVTAHWAEPGLLIGAEYCGRILMTIVDHNQDKGFKVVQSKVGPMLMGKGPIVTTTLRENKEAETALDKKMESFWNLEHIGINDCPYENDDDVAIKHFEKNVKCKDGRYIVKWPWKEANPELPTNLQLCKGRLKSTIKKLQEKPELLLQYDAILRQQLENGIIEEIDPNEKEGSVVHYLPHHAVITPSKTTTKVRIVYDASAKQRKDQRSLNECLYQGPLLLPDLCGMLLRHRTYDIAIMADIEKAFHQIELEEDDRDAVRFLWLADINKPVHENNIRHFRFRRVTFGVVCSPFLLAATIRYHLQLQQTELAEEIKNNIYADNILLGAKTVDEAMEKCEKAKRTFQLAQMNLREFLSNSQQINEKFADTDQKPTAKFLGLAWNVKEDTLAVSWPGKTEVSAITKRSVLQTIASAFDPLGLISPAMLPAKLLQQSLCQKYSWEDRLEKEDECRWIEIMEKNANKAFIVPRKVLSSNKSYELHVFVDASKEAYAVAAYCKEIGISDQDAVHLIWAKSRINPIKPITIPRLELLAATMGARAIKFISKELRKQPERIVLWSDSTCVLSWIRAFAATVPKFVENRLREIKTVQAEFRYVPTADNPADIATRGSDMEDLIANQLWRHGPKWLVKEESEWPKMPEISSIPAKVVTMVIQNDNIICVDATRIGLWQKLLRVQAYVNRFIKKRVLDRIAKPRGQFFQQLKNIQNQEPLNAKEIQLAIEEIFRRAQEKHPPSKNEIEKWDLKMDKNGIWKCEGRMQQSSMAEAAKHPVFLPRNDRVTQLLILHVHQKNGHVGARQTLTQLRQQYWLPKPIATINNVIKHQCFACKRYKVKPFAQPQMPPLPAERVQQAAPFANCGIDYFGPVTVTEGGEKRKVWVALFTCMTTRAIHLELVRELSAKACVQALRKFVARRGRPQLIISDNAAQFQLVAKTVVDEWKMVINDPDVMNYCADQQIKWKFITQLAPWQGGFYERMVALVKQAMRVSIGRRILALDEFETLLHESEAIVNCRPLTAIDDDPNNERILRPMDFLQPYSRPGVPDMESDVTDEPYTPGDADSKTQLTNWWRQQTAALDRFWKQWHEQYLPSLREKQTREHKTPRCVNETIPKPGDVVPIHEENEPRAFWKIGRVVTIHTSDDKEVRTAEVRTGNGNFLRRAINRLYPMEIASEQHEAKAANSLDNERQPNTPQATSRYNLRKQLRKNYAFVVTMLLCFINGIRAEKCLEENPKVQYVDICAQRGIGVAQTNNGTFCWDEINCFPQHIRITDASNRIYCGEACPCPAWSESCSFYKGPNTANSTTKDAKTLQLLQRSQPNVCGFLPNPKCQEKPTYRLISQILLYDETMHSVEELQINIKEITATDFRCIGEGEETGTPIFCKQHHCEAEGSRFCFYPSQEIAMWTTDEGQVAVKAWGKIKTAVFDFQPEEKGCERCQVSCKQGGVKLELDNIEAVEVCSENHCEHIKSPKEEEEIELPLDIVSTAYQAEATLWRDGYIAKRQIISCQASVYCEAVKCTLCWEAWHNPHCISKVKAVALIVVLYVGLVMLAIACKCLLRSAKLIRLLVGWIWYRNAQRYPTRRLIILNVIILLIIPTIEGCAETTALTTKQHNCQRDKYEQISCRFEAATTLTLEPEGQKVCIWLTDDRERPVATIAISVNRTVAQCNKAVAYYSRDWEQQLAAVRRCPGRGSCINNACEKTTVDSKVEELGRANQFPGHTRCADAVSCWANGCFKCGSACLFYRVHAVPKTDRILEVYTCPSWETEIHMDIEIQRQTTKEKKQWILRPGRIAEWNRIKMAITGISIPPMPLLATTFVTDGTTTAIVTEDLQKAMQDLQCGTREEARNFSCKLAPDVCHCLPSQDTANCLCRADDAAERTFRTNALPDSQQGIWLTPKEQGIEAKIPWTAITMQLSIDGLQAQAIYDKTTCQVTIHEVSGCFSCKKGAVVQFQCTAEFGEALAEIDCTTVQFVVPCNDNKALKTVIINFQRADIDEQCEVRCPNSKQIIQLKATLTPAPIGLIEWKKPAATIPQITSPLFQIALTFPVTVIVTMIACLVVSLWCCRLWGMSPRKRRII